MKARLKLFVFSIIILSSHFVAAQSANLYINELLASNTSTIKSPDYGEFADWIEIYNKNNSPVDLGGYYLTDDLKESKKWKIPLNTMIAPNGYRLFWADGYDNGLHTNFKLNRDGEIIILLNPSGIIVDSISFGHQYDDISYGRFSDNLSKLSYFKPPTPQSINIGGNQIQIAPIPKFSIQGGFYKVSQSLTLLAENPLSEIRYTIDGTVPTKLSKLYNGPIKLDSTTAIQAVTFEIGKNSSPVVTQTYFINEDVHLPVVSIVTDPANLFDDKIGIYVTGTNGTRGACDPTVRNLNQDWERPINIELYELSGKCGFNQGAGIKIFGGCSRTRYPQKSFAVYARSEYGKGSFDYRLFSSKPIKKFESFILRSSSDDQVYTMFRDALAHSVMADVMDADIEAYEPAVLFINGKYWGIHNIREKPDENYLANNFGVDPKDVNILESNGGVVVGSNAGYTNMVNFVNNYNMAIQSNYEYIKSWMDVNQYIDYQIGHIYLAERDWPGNNIKFWRANSDQYSKWRWINFDLDQTTTMIWVYEDMINKTTTTSGSSWPNPEWSTRLFRNLLKNDEFKNEFIQRYAFHQNTTFKPERLIHFIDSLSSKIAPEIPRHIKKWGGQRDPDMHEGWTPKLTFASVQEWNSNVDEMRKFANQRPLYSFTQMANHFALSGTSDITVKLNSYGSGILKIIDRKIPDGFIGKFYNDIPLRFSAVPIHGKKFSYWEVEGSASQVVQPISSGSVWKYNDSGTDLKSVWTQLNFDDTKWLYGPAQLGYGDGDEKTILSYGPNSSNKYITAYFRKTFDVADKSKIEFLEFEILVDDGAVIYLNGSEIQRVNMPSGSIQFSTLASGNAADENAFTKFHVVPNNLVNGTNVIAIEVHQASVTSSDLSFDLKMSETLTISSNVTKYTSPDISIILNGNTNLTAYFENDLSNQSIPVVINEINYKSASDFDSEDWIEIYNYGNVQLNLFGWHLKDSAENSKFEFRNNVYLGAKEYLVLCKDTSLFSSRYPKIKNRMGNFEFGLSSTGEKITLVDASGKIIDEVNYSDQNSWPGNTNGTGRTIELKNCFVDNNLGSAWAVSAYMHGTPGMANSTFTDIQKRFEELPKEFSLDQNYPNPFNPSTKIRFSIQTRGMARLRIYNILGELVSTLVDKELTPGEYVYEWNGRNENGVSFSSGVYIYELTSGEFRAAKRMVLLR